MIERKLPVLINIRASNPANGLLCTFTRLKAQVNLKLNALNIEKKKETNLLVHFNYPPSKKHLKLIQ